MMPRSRRTAETSEGGSERADSAQGFSEEQNRRQTLRSSAALHFSAGTIVGVLVQDCGFRWFTTWAVV
jgi:hypothetical protein